MANSRLCREPPAPLRPLSVSIDEERIVKYLLMIWGNPQNWDTGSDDSYAEYLALDRALLESGELVLSAELADPVLTRTVRVRHGAVAVTDGPFAEAKEQLAGYFLIDCATPDRALEIAAMIPAAHTDRVEVRPVMDTAGPDL